MFPRAAVVAAVILSAGSIGCDASTASPVPPGDEYVLRSIADMPVPAPWAPNTALDTRMMSATLTLRPDGTGSWHAVVEESVGGTTYQQDSEFTYGLTGTAISVSFTCPDLASCIAGPHLTGRVTATGIIFTTSLTTRAPLVFDVVP